jgi:NitT/TauT family transport system ATP-binding protein
VALADRVVVMTVSPGTIKDVFEIDLPRPRGAVQEIRFDPRFLALHRQIWDSLREEVQRAYRRTAEASGNEGAIS